ncbi:hypothetical protein A5651_17730 [Mycobacterium sp. 1274761.0]|nr:hypothetical protein A5651_17730 [Mycobacterium sp. 1274761.0]
MCGIAWNGGALVVARLLQGVVLLNGAAAMFIGYTARQLGEPQEVREPSRQTAGRRSLEVFAGI